MTSPEDQTIEEMLDEIWNEVMKDDATEEEWRLGDLQFFTDGTPALDPQDGYDYE